VFWFPATRFVAFEYAVCVRAIRQQSGRGSELARIRRLANRTARILDLAGVTGLCCIEGAGS